MSSSSLNLLSNLIVSCDNNDIHQDRDSQSHVVMVEHDELRLPQQLHESSPSMAPQSHRDSSIWGNLTGLHNQCDDWFQYQVTSTATSTKSLSFLQSVLRNASIVTNNNSNSSSHNSTLPSQGDGFSIAVWFSVPTSTISANLDDNNTSSEYPILSFASPYKKDVWTGCPGWSDIELTYMVESGEEDTAASTTTTTTTTTHVNSNRSQTTKTANQALFLRYVDSDDARTCRSVRIDASSAPLASTMTTSPADNQLWKDHHVVVAWTTSSLHIFWQGQPAVSTVVSVPFDTALSTWDPTDRLQLLRKPSTTSGTQYDDDDGRPDTYESILGVHQVQFYGQGLESETVSQLYEAGFQHGIWNESNSSLVQLTPNVVPNVIVMAQDAIEPVSFDVGGSLVWSRDLSILSQEAEGAIEDYGGLLLAVHVMRFPKYGAISATGGIHRRTKKAWEWELPLQLINVTNTSLTLNFILLDHDFYNLPLQSNNSHRSSHLGNSVDATLSIVWRQQVLANDYVSIPVEIQQVNYPPKLTAPYLVEASQASVYLMNVTLTDIDVTIPVRVDVLASHSQITLSSNYISLADFVTCRQRSDSPWQCVGDGVRDRTFIFVAPTGAVNHILNRMQVDLTQNDNVTIRIYDGQGGDCLSAREHALYGSALTIHRGCYVAEASINIVVDPSLVRTQLGNTANVSRIAKLLFWGLTFTVVLGIVVCLRRCLPRCLARSRRRGAIDADDGGSGLPRNVSDVNTASVGKSISRNDLSSSNSESAYDSDDDEEDDIASC